MLFRLLGNDHNEGGRTFEKGAIIDSPYNLVKMFPLKFERALPHERPTPLPKAVGVREPRLADGEQAEAPVSTRNDDSGENPAGLGAEAAAAVVADDVTMNYPTAQQHGLHVFMAPNKKDFFVTGEDNNALNEKPLAKNRVKIFITEYLEKRAEEAAKEVATGN